MAHLEFEKWNAMERNKPKPELANNPTESDLLRIRIELEALITEREGMTAGNARVVYEHMSPVFGETDYVELTNKITALLERIK